MLITKNIKQLLLLFALLGILLPALAQEPEVSASAAAQDCGLTLSGKAIDHDSREPLVGATILLVEKNISAITDVYGNYHFHHLCQGSYTIRATYVGYEETSTTFRLSSSAVRNITLHVDSRTLGAVEVVGSQADEQPQATETLTGRELAETQGLSLGESLKKLTGVSSVQTGPNVSKPVIHGLFGNRVLIINNGVRHESQQWGNEHAPELDPLMARKLTVVKGAAGVRYGSDAIGGIVLADPAPLPDSAGAKGAIGLIGSTNTRMGVVSGMAEGKLNRWPLSWRLHSSLKKAGSARTPDYRLHNTGFEEQNISAGLGYKRSRFSTELYYSYFHTKTGLLSAAHIGNLTDLANAIAREQPETTGDFSYTIERPYQDVTHQLAKAKGTYKTGEAGELQFTYGFQHNIRQEYDRHRRRDDSPELNLDLLTHTTELVWEHEPVGGLSGSIGASTIWQNNTYEGRALLPFFRNSTWGVFWQEQWRKGNLQLESGVRYEYKDLAIKRREQNQVLRPEYVFHNFSGSFGAIYDWGYHLILKGIVSYASRAPHTYELFANGLHNSAATFEFGNPDFISENAISTTGTLVYHSNHRLNGELSLYHNLIHNYIYLQLSPDYTLGISGAYLTGYYQQADARFWGGDLSLRFNITGNLVLENKTSVVRALNTETSSFLPYISPDRTDNTLRYTFSDKAGKAVSGAYVAAGGLLVARQHRSDAQSDPVLAAPANYFLLHAEAGTNLRIGKQELEVGVTGSNLLNTAYRDYQNRLRFFADEVGRILMFRVKVPLHFTRS
ncbi:TonB-dependent receptor [Botryobacter ruber]|uniref:TonB-dependent receptor n=1 Tax=Botryobacter ruber TaxID=2171629 RepID=UPI000E09FE09|nr:TonB-dependent receptor [Botryobacter ruber]